MGRAPSSSGQGCRPLEPLARRAGDPGSNPGGAINISPTFPNKDLISPRGLYCVVICVNLYI